MPLLIKFANVSYNKLDELVNWKVRYYRSKDNRGNAVAKSTPKWTPNRTQPATGQIVSRNWLGEIENSSNTRMVSSFEMWRIFRLFPCRTITYLGWGEFYRTLAARAGTRSADVPGISFRINVARRTGKGKKEHTIFEYLHTRELLFAICIYQIKMK